MGYHRGCKKCDGFISRYEIDVDDDESEEIRNYQFKLCWGCGFFSILPNVRDEFTDAILKDRTLIMDLIEDDQLKPIL